MKNQQIKSTALLPQFTDIASSCRLFLLVGLCVVLPACANTDNVTAVNALTNRIADEASLVAGTDAVLPDYYMEWRIQRQFSLSNPDATCEPAFAFLDNGLLSRNRVASGTACTQYTFGELRVLPRSGNTNVEVVNVTATITHVGQGTGCSTINSVSPWVYLIEKCGVSGTGTYTVQLLTNTIYRMETNAQPHGAGNSYESVITLNLAGPTDDAPTTFTSENGPVNAAQDHSCALRGNGSTVCWSYGPYGQLNVPASERLTRVSTGFATSCGIRENKTMGCWGIDGSGPTNASPGEFIQVSAGQYAVCGLRTNHTVTCRGGGIVPGQEDNELPPGTYKEVSAGLIQHCGVRMDGTLACHGPPYFSQPPTPAGRFLQVSTGEGAHSCAIRTDRSILCWGSNQNQQLEGVPTSGTFKQVSTGTWGACALRDDDAVLCWGNRNNGVQNPPPGPFSFVSVGGGHACGQRPTGAIVCWGDNSRGQLNVPADLREVVDQTPPVIAPLVSGELGNNGWYRSDVSVQFSVSDPESDITNSDGCDDAIVRADTPGIAFTCSATSAGGTAQATETVKRDATKPLVTFDGRLSYTVDEDVAISCDARDELSGLAESTCAATAGPAYTFGVGEHAFSAKAKDNAGNEAVANGSFTVVVTAESLCTLVERWVAHAGMTSSLCAKLDAARRAGERGDANARAGQIGAFVNEVEAQSGKYVPADKAITLTILARAL